MDEFKSKLYLNRRKNLIKLRNERFEGVTQRMADFLKQPHRGNQLRQFCANPEKDKGPNPHWRPMSEKHCRGLEKELGLENGFFNQIDKEEERRMIVKMLDLRPDGTIGDADCFYSFTPNSIYHERARKMAGGAGLNKLKAVIVPTDHNDPEHLKFIDLMWIEQWEPTALQQAAITEGDVILVLREFVKKAANQFSWFFSTYNRCQQTGNILLNFDNPKYPQIDASSNENIRETVHGRALSIVTVKMI